MVYGYARQSGGTAKIYSELGEGTEISLYFPRVRDVAAVQIDQGQPDTCRDRLGPYSGRRRQAERARDGRHVA